jgi:hypothetical protein
MKTLFCPHCGDGEILEGQYLTDDSEQEAQYDGYLCSRCGGFWTLVTLGVCTSRVGESPSRPRGRFTRHPHRLDVMGEAPHPIIVKPTPGQCREMIEDGRKTIS